MQASGCRVQGAGCRVQGSRCRVQGAGCRVQGAGGMVQGSDLELVNERARTHEPGYGQPREPRLFGGGGTH